MATLLHDLKYALRGLAGNPTFSCVAVLTLGVGIGTATAIFSVADHVVFRDLPYADAERVVTLWETDRVTGERRRNVCRRGSGTPARRSPWLPTPLRAKRRARCAAAAHSTPAAAPHHPVAASLVPLAAGQQGGDEQPHPTTTQVWPRSGVCSPREGVCSYSRGS